ncbi:molybdenum cofactor biosynthesis protein MoaE [Cytophagaceae bacterium ABcell3]|nr:molybdenum cofactor biosynthesis protein MoaE [Cytophagaceae bacterium ABcell3]
MEKLFIQGPIKPLFVSEVIQKHASDYRSGAFTMFLGQIRNDEIDGQEVQGIEYTAYEEMAEKAAQKIIEESIKSFELNTVQIYHSLGLVKTGEASLFVLVTAGHRPNVFKACAHIVERIKKELPVWGKEIFDNNTYTWKKNIF